MYTDMYETNFNCIICGLNKSFRKFPQVIKINYGDTIYLSFDIKDISNQGLINLIFYDYELEEIYSIENISTDEIENGTLQVILSSELSQNFFRKGIYYIKMVYSYIKDDQEIVETLLNQQDFQLSVL